MISRACSVRSQQGMVLIVSLILLLSLTLLGLASMQNTSLEERMAGNVRAENIALQAAESALRTAEQWLSLVPSRPDAVDAGDSGNSWPSGSWPMGIDVWFPGDDVNGEGPYSVMSPVIVPWWAHWTFDQWAARGEAVLDGDLTYVIAREGVEAAALEGTRTPRFVIERDGVCKERLNTGLQEDLDPERFLITARGVDAGARGEVFLQARFCRRF